MAPNKALTTAAVKYHAGRQADLRLRLNHTLERSLGSYLYNLPKDKGPRDVKLDASVVETPMRWMKAMREMTSGYAVNIPALFKQFDGQKYDGLVVVGPVKFYSLCEHHLFPFHGNAWVGYIPGRSGRIVGLSKLARLVVAHAKRLQVQERMTADIARDIAKHLGAKGVGVRIESEHTCMCARGVEKEGVMRTQTLLGAFKKATTRSEWLELCRKAD